MIGLSLTKCRASNADHLRPRGAWSSCPPERDLLQLAQVQSLPPTTSCHHSIDPEKRMNVHSRPTTAMASVRFAPSM
jgi:hypothetical protein